MTRVFLGGDRYLDRRDTPTGDAVASEDDEQRQQVAENRQDHDDRLLQNNHEDVEGQHGLEE